jgi:hypothetical protein
MAELPKVVSKKGWFLTFNVLTIIYLIWTKTLSWDPSSIFWCFLALLIMNGIAWTSARKYKD